MKIYRLAADWDNYAIVRGATVSDREFMRAGWKQENPSRLVQLVKVEDSRDLPLGDFLTLGTNVPMIMSESAYHALGRDLSKCGHFFPASCEGAPYQLFFPEVVIDCLSIEKSKIQTTATGYKQLQEPSFHADKLPTFILFQVARVDHSPIFVKQEFIDKAKRSHLDAYTTIQYDAT